MSVAAKNPLKISELARECGLPISTIRHYINERLLGNPRKTSKNMAYYDHDSIPRISLIKKLQDELYLPLNVIGKLLKASDEDCSFEVYNRIVEVRKRLTEHTDLLPEMASIPHSEVFPHLALTEDEMLTLEKLGAISPEVKDGERFYDEVDYRIIKALSDFRTAGFTAELGFSTDDLIVYLEIMKDLARLEFSMFGSRVSKDLSVAQIADLIGKGLSTVDEIMTSLHHKFLTAEFRNREKSAKGKT